MANATIERQNATDGRPRAGQLQQRALGHGNERATGNVNVCTKTWMETCTALRMTPQSSPFQWAQAGVGVERLAMVENTIPAGGDDGGAS